MPQTRCPNLKDDQVREDWNAILSRLGGKPMSDADVAGKRQSYVGELSDKQRTAYYQAHALWNDHASAAEIGKFLDAVDRVRAEIGSPEQPAEAAEKERKNSLLEMGFKHPDRYVYAMSSNLPDESRVLFNVRVGGTEEDPRLRLTKSFTFKTATGSPSQEMGVFGSYEEVAKAVRDELDRLGEKKTEKIAPSSPPEEKIDIKEAVNKPPLDRTDDENQALLEHYEGKKFKSAADERQIKVLKARIAALPSKWKAGDGVGYRVAGQINRGFRIVSINPDAKTAVVRQVADTGITTTGGADRLRDQTVHIADLVRDRKYEAKAVEESIERAEDLSEAFDKSLEEQFAGEAAAKAARSLPESFAAHFRAGERFSSIVEARKFAKDAGFELDPKAVDEAVEAGVISAARDIVRSAGTPGEAFKSLVDLYERQPRLGTRTGASVTNQAYSTPVPLAYVASRLAGVSQALAVYEPTAGNGALLIEADPRAQAVVANEIDPTRLAELTRQGFRPTAQDGSRLGQDKEIPQIDSVIMNPPFGAVREGGQSKVFTTPDGWTTTHVDQAIALNALQAMGDKGKAVLILGGVKAESIEDLRAGYRERAKREFYFRLYKQYKVTDHFTVSGDLYEKQGAGWPVDVVVIDGRVSADNVTTRQLPAAVPPAILKTWAEVGERIPDADVQSRTPGQPPGRENVPDREPVRGPSAPVQQPLSGDAGGGAAPGGIRPGGLHPDERLDPGEVRGGTPGEPEPAGEGGRHGQPDSVPPTGRDDRGLGERSAPGREYVEKTPNAAGQVNYDPASTVGNKIGTLAPQALDRAMRSSLDRLEAKRGPVAKFVGDRLGYGDNLLAESFSPEQIDAIGLAIDNVESGSAMIIGDQAGVGKGRVGAALLYYAHRNGKIPVFVTEKDGLYADMLRDMGDIHLADQLGREPRIFITNTGSNVPIDDEAIAWKEEFEIAKAEGLPLPKRRGKFLQGGSANQSLENMRHIALDPGTKKFDFVFTTYDQMSTVKGQSTPRREFIERIAPNAIFIADESHNAGGSEPGMFKPAVPNRAQFIRKIAGLAHGIMFSSATYAKSPEVMDLYSRTDLGRAVDDLTQLPFLIKRGGVPLQQVIASMLGDSGQYMRREQDMAGISYSMEHAPVNERTYETFSDAIRAVNQFDLMIQEFRKNHFQDFLDQLGGTTLRDAAIGDLSVSSTNFSSIMHNVVGQMLFGIKANQVAERAIQAIRENEKPVIAVANTMESFVGEYAKDKGISVGKPIDIGFQDVLSRYLARTLRLTVKDPNKNVSHIYIPVDALSAEQQRAYREALDRINEGDFSGIPVSPIDWIRHQMKSSDVSVREITGRTKMIDYGSSPPRLVDRPSSESGTGGKASSIRAFNGGKLDAIVMNRSASTGISLHSRYSFPDTRKRRMIVAQPEGNIDTVMQMFGRVNRTGQVVKPSYSHIVAAVPAEARYAAILMKKMASLNANTTGARKGVFTAEAVDFMNPVGASVIRTILTLDPELDAKLGGVMPYEGDEDVPDEDPEAIVRKTTGRLVLLPPKEQEELLDRIQQGYKTTLERLIQLGENPLEAPTVDLQAKTLDATELRAQRGEGPFMAPVMLEQISAKAQGRAMEPAEAIEELVDYLKIKRPSPDPAVSYDRLADDIRQHARKLIEEFRTEASAYAKMVAPRILTEQEKADMKPGVAAEYEKSRNTKIEDLTNRQRRWLKTMSIAHPGAMVRLDVGGEPYDALVTRLKRSGTEKEKSNPLALSTWDLHFVVPSAERKFVIPVSALYPPGFTRPEGKLGGEISYAQSSFRSFVDALDQSRKEGREKRYIMTGNMMAAFEETYGHGQIINYSTDTGEVRQGILMSRSFDKESFEKERPVRFQTIDQLRSFIEQVGDRKITISSSDRYIQVGFTGGQAEIKVAAARSTGGRYYTDTEVRDALGGEIDFKRHDKWMELPKVSIDRGLRILEVMRRVGAVFETRSNQKIAQDIVGASSAQKNRMPSIGAARARETGPSDFRSALRRAVLTPRAEAVKDKIKSDLTEIVRRVAGDKVALKFSDTLPLDPRDLEGWGEYGTEAEAITAAGLFTPRDKLIELALADPRYRGIERTTAYHESYHAVEYLLQTDAERSLMQSPREMARLREKIGRSYHGLTPDQIANLYGHEVRAIAFEAYAAAREAGSSNAGAGLHIAIRRFFEKLFNLLRRVRNYLKGLGFHTADDIFSRAYEGEFTKREPSPAGTPEEFVSERANVLGTERHPKEHLTVNGQPAWAMVVDNTDHAVTHTVRYRQAIDSDWNHNFYLPPHVRNSVSRGEARVVWADARGIHSMEPMPESMRRDLHQYASVPSSQRGPVMANITPPPPPPGGTTTTSPPPGQTPPPSRLRSAIGNLLDSAAGTRAIEGVYDLSHRVKMLRDEVAARMMGVLPDSRDFYTRKRLFPGRVGTSINEFDSKHLDPLVRFLKDNKITLDEASDYLYARHAGERNKAMDEINPDLGGSGSGMTDDEADLILNDAARKNGPAFSELAKRVAEMRNWTLRYMEKSGLEKPETIKSWRDKYTDYVPLRGWEVPPSDFQEPPRGSGIGFNIRGREVQPAFGRRSKADNPLINTIEQAYRTVERGEKNRYLNTLYRALKELGPNNSADIGTLDKGKPKREIDKTTGLVHFVDTTNQFGNPNAVHLKIDGDQHFIVFNDRELAEAVRRLSPDSLGPLQFILKLQNKLKAIWTHYSPDFLAGHFLGRYPIEGTLNSFELKESGKHKINKYVRDGFPFLGNASRAIFLSHKGEVSEDPEIKRLQDEWKQLSKAGGAMVFRNMRDIDLLGEHMRTQLIGLRGKPLETIRAKWRRAIEAMDVVTNALDNALRLAAGSAALRQGKSIDQAALIAREATVDFQLKGKWSNIIGVWFPFANVANQTAARMAKALYRSRIMRRVFIGTMLAGFLTSAFNYLFYGNDKDGVPFFDKIPPWEKRLNFIVLTPANDKEGRPEPFKVPMPYNWAMPLMLGYAFGNAIWGSTGIGKNLSEVIHSLLEGLTPMGNEASIAGLASPELIRPVTHISANKDWTGRPVHTDPLFQHGLSSESPLKGKRAAGTGYQIAARGISKATAGLIDLYPEDIREIFGYMLSTPLKQASEFVTTGKSLAKLEMPDPTQFPVLRRFWGADYDAATQARLGERQHEITHPWESGATIEDITKWQRESFQAIQAERVKVNRDTSLSPEDRRTQLADLAHRRKSVESTAARARAEIKRLHRKENTRTTLEAPPQLTE